MSTAARKISPWRYCLGSRSQACTVSGKGRPHAGSAYASATQWVCSSWSPLSWASFFLSTRFRGSLVLMKLLHSPEPHLAPTSRLPPLEMRHPLMQGSWRRTPCLYHSFVFLPTRPHSCSGQHQHGADLHSLRARSKRHECWRGALSARRGTRRGRPCAAGVGGAGYTPGCAGTPPLGGRSPAGGVGRR